MRKDCGRIDARDIIGDSPTLERDMAMLKLSFMPKPEREHYLKHHKELLNNWKRIERDLMERPQS